MEVMLLDIRNKMVTNNVKIITLTTDKSIKTRYLYLFRDSGQACSKLTEAAAALYVVWKAIPIPDCPWEKRILMICSSREGYQEV
jgi:hypothetical protein